MEEINELANYCLNCKVKPCQSGCPLMNDIPEFIKNVKENNYEQAYKVLSKTTVLESVCGRICPHMSQCMGKCVRGIKSNPVNIGNLEAYVGDMALKYNYSMDDEKNIKDDLNKNENLVNNSSKKIAIIGSGPAGLTCAAFLVRNGFDVTIYEKYDKLGGLLRYGIPEFRLPKNILDDVINKIINLGVKVKYNSELGVNLFLDDLVSDFDKIFIAIGANIPWKMGIKGEDLAGVYGGNTLLEKNLHPDYTGKKVAVIGGGNVAMDCARTIKKLGAKEVTVIYRRAEEQMPAEKKEIEDAREEGVDFLFQTNVVELFGDSVVKEIECIKTELVQKEGETRLSPVDVKGSNFKMNIDYVVMAIGSTVEDNVVNSLGLECNSKGYIKVDENYLTSNKNIYAGGDVAGVKATVAWAARSGRDVAEHIINNCY